MSSKIKQNKTYDRVKIQPPLLALIHIVMSMALTWLRPLPLVVPAILRTGGFLLMILGFLLGMGALIAFRRSRKAVNSHDPLVRLVTSGVYRFSRNPVYLGFLLMQIGLPLNAGSYWGIIITPIMVILFNRLVIEDEEKHLAYTFGDQYKSYSSKVRRWI